MGNSHKQWTSQQFSPSPSAIAGVGKTLGRPASLADETLGRSVGRARLWVSPCTKLSKLDNQVVFGKQASKHFRLLVYWGRKIDIMNANPVNSDLGTTFAYIYVHSCPFPREVEMLVLRTGQ